MTLHDTLVLIIMLNLVARTCHAIYKLYITMGLRYILRYDLDSEKYHEGPIECRN